MSERAARWTALFAIVLLLVPILYLAAGLPGTEFSGGRPFAEREPVAARPRSSGSAGAMRPLDWLTFVPIAVLLVAVVVYAAIRLRGRAGVSRRRSLAQLVLFALVMLALAFIAREKILQNLAESAADAQAAEGVATSDTTASDYLDAPTEAAPATAETDARGTSLLFQAFFAVVALAASTALAVAISRLRARRPRPAPPLTEDLLAPVNAALAKLRQGRDAAGVVEECYRDMMALLAKALDLNPRTLTPREFARAATDLGLDEQAIGGLTELFELVRYGRRPDEPLAGRALDCMTRLRGQLAPVGGVP